MTRLSTNWGSSYSFNGLGGFRALGAGLGRAATAAEIAEAGRNLDELARAINVAADLGFDAGEIGAWRTTHASISAVLAEAATMLGADPDLAATEAVVAGLAAEARELLLLIQRAVPAVARARLTSVALWTGFGVLATVGVVLGVAYYSRKKRRRPRARRRKRR